MALEALVGQDWADVAVEFAFGCQFFTGLTDTRGKHDADYGESWRQM
jgi:hypothetical protein